jgi:hypothetical protein
MTRERSRIERAVGADVFADLRDFLGATVFDRKANWFVWLTSALPITDSTATALKITEQTMSTPATAKRARATKPSACATNFNLFPHLKKLLRVVARVTSDSGIRIPKQGAKPCAVGLRAVSLESECPYWRVTEPVISVSFWLTTRFHAASCPANVASNLSERRAMSLSG